MTFFIGIVVMLNFLVNLLLLLAAGRICGAPVKKIKIVLSAALGGLYAWGCLQAGMNFLGNSMWRVVSLGVMSMIAFGMNRSTIQRGFVFALLSFALGGAVQMMGNGGFWGKLAAASVLYLSCSMGFQRRIGGSMLVPVELQYNGKRLHLTALQDTGNTLTDPVTGQQVLIISAEATQRLIGLTQSQLRSPVETMGVLPGLRLIPYRSIGISGFLLAMKLKDVQIGTWRGSSLVAFAPDGLGLDEEYQALTGGAI